ncbi:hypothetical protein GGQ85_004315 [Nitrobacter vulgaris]|nr:hypothetical protein [Nitrobacter vulgaris]
MVLLDHILPEARTLIDTQYAGYPPVTAPTAPPTAPPIGPAARSPSRAPRSMPPTTPWAMADAGKIKAIDIAVILKKERIINSAYHWGGSATRARVVCSIELESAMNCERLT